MRRFIVLAAMASLSAAAEESKLSPELLRTIRDDAEARVDVMVQLTSPSQAVQASRNHADAADLSRTSASRAWPSRSRISPRTRSSR